MEISLSRAATFLDRLDPGGSFSFQTFDDIEDRRGLLRVLHGKLNDVAGELIRLNDAGAGVFVTVNATDGRGRKSENVVRVRAVFVDLDGAPLEPVRDVADVPPHIIVESSPGKWHCYWLVDDLDPFYFKPAQLALAARFGGDRAVSDLPRVMRLPGFIHRKRQPFMTDLVVVDLNRPPYPAATFIAPADWDDDSAHVSAPKKPATDVDLWVAHCALQIIPTSLDWHQRNYVGMAAWRGCDGDEYGFESWCDWLRRSGRFDEHAARRQWNYYYRSKPNRIGLGTLVFLARQVRAGWYEEVMDDLLDEPRT